MSAPRRRATRAVLRRRRARGRAPRVLETTARPRARAARARARRADVAAAERAAAEARPLGPCSARARGAAARSAVEARRVRRFGRVANVQIAARDRREPPPRRVVRRPRAVADARAPRARPRRARARPRARRRRRLARRGRPAHRKPRALPARATPRAARFRAPTPSMFHLRAPQARARASGASRRPRLVAVTLAPAIKARERARLVARVRAPTSSLRSRHRGHVLRRGVGASASSARCARAHEGHRRSGSLERELRAPPAPPTVASAVAAARARRPRRPTARARAAAAPRAERARTVASSRSELRLLPTARARAARFRACDARRRLCLERGAAALTRATPSPKRDANARRRRMSFVLRDVLSRAAFSKSSEEEAVDHPRVPERPRARATFESAGAPAETRGFRAGVARRRAPPAGVEWVLVERVDVRARVRADRARAPATRGCCPA